MTTNVRRRLALGYLLLGCSTPALAAEPVRIDPPAADAAGTPRDEADPAPADETASPSEPLQEVIVTATKRATNLQKTPIAISVIDSTMVKDRHIQSLINLADGSVPSLRVATFESRQSALTIGIRGIVPFDQNQTARDSGVGVYIDGVYMGRTQGLNAALFDVQRIEVLRGPQGTLFGRNTEGGALSIVTRAPSNRFGGRVTAGLGSYGERNGEVHVDLPLADTFSLKIDGVYQHQDATTKNPAVGQYGWNFHDRVGGRIAGRWTPTDTLTVDAAFDRAHDQNTPFYSQLLNYNPLNKPVGQYRLNPANNRYVLVAPGAAPGVYTACSACIAPLSPLVQVADERMDIADLGVIQQPSVDDTDGAYVSVNYKVAPSVELRSITAWRGVETHQWDGSAGAHRSAFVPNGQFGRYSLSELEQDQFSQEFQLVGGMDQFDYVLGAYYFTENAREVAATPNPEMWNATGTSYTFVNQRPPNPGAPITSSNQGWERDFWFVQRDSNAHSKSYAAFGQGTFTPAALPNLHVTAGGRWTRDERDGALTMLSMVPTPYTFRFRNNRFDPLFIAAYDAADGINLYAKYATGFRAGGANSRSATFRAFGPESVKSYELGAKMDLLNKAARLNLAAYVMDRKGTQIDFDFVDTTQFLPGGVPNPNYNRHTEETVNAPGTSRIKGLEADLTLRPTDALTLGGSYAYTDVDVPATANPLPGQTFGVITEVFTVFTPKHSASAYADLALPFIVAGSSGLKLHVDGNYASRQYSFQSEDVLTEPSFIMNASATIADVPVGKGETTASLTLWSRNLLNESHIYRRSNANAGVIGDYGNFNPPRTVGLQGTINF